MDCAQGRRSSYLVRARQILLDPGQAGPDLDDFLFARKQLEEHQCRHSQAERFYCSYRGGAQQVEWVGAQSCGAESKTGDSDGPDSQEYYATRYGRVSSHGSPDREEPISCNQHTHSSCDRDKPNALWVNQ